VLGSVLAAGAEAGFVSDGYGLGVVDPPQEGVVFDGGEDDIGLIVCDRAHRVLDGGGVDERRGALHEHRDVVVLVEGRQGVDERGFAGGGVAGDLCGTVGDLGAGAQGFGGDALVVGRDDHAVDAGAGLRGVDRAGQQRDPGDLLQVLQGDALGPAAGRDDRDRAVWGGPGGGVRVTWCSGRPLGRGARRRRRAGCGGAGRGRLIGRGGGRIRRVLGCGGFGSRRKVIHNDSTLTTRCYFEVNAPCR